MDVSLVILTYNGIRHLELLFQSIRIQSIKPEIIVIDSESTDGTREFLTENGISFSTIAKTEFDHGGTRNLGLSLAKTEIVIFITQDVILDNVDSLELLIEPLKKDAKIAMTFGRQLPKNDATILSQFARLNNYPEMSSIKSSQDIPRLGIKTCFISNSFSAYKKSVLQKLGSFPSNLIMCEDAFVGAKAILDDYKIAYVAEARVFHSHNYTLTEEFKRYFDIGYFYSSESWITKNFNGAEKEGLSYIKKEMQFILKKGYVLLLPEFILRNFAKYAGYKLGKYPDVIPQKWKKYFSMHSYYWNSKNKQSKIS